MFQDFLIVRMTVFILYPMQDFDEAEKLPATQKITINPNDVKVFHVPQKLHHLVSSPSTGGKARSASICQLPERVQAHGLISLLSFSVH